MVGYPLDTVKVKIQTQDPSMGLKYKGTFDCLAQLIKQDGVSSICLFFLEKLPDLIFAYFILCKNSNYCQYSFLPLTLQTM